MFQNKLKQSGIRKLDVLWSCTSRVTQDQGAVTSGAQGLADVRCPKEVILKDILKWGCHPIQRRMSLLSQPSWTCRAQPRTLLRNKQKALCSLPLNLGGSDCYRQLRFKVVCSHSVLTDERPRASSSSAGILLVCGEGLLW